MAEILCNWWVKDSDNWAKLQTTMTWLGVNYIVPVLVKESTVYVDGETRDAGNIYLFGKVTEHPQNASYVNEIIGGTYEPSSLITNWYAGRIDGAIERNGYRYYALNRAADIKGWYTECYTYDSWEDLIDAIDGGDLQPLSTKVYFDVYINGSDKPSLYVNWTAGEDLSPVVLSPKVWFGVESLILDNDIVQDSTSGLNVPNVNNWNVQSAGNYSYAGSLQTTYLSIMEDFEPYLNPVSKLAYWGFNGEPEFVRLYLRMDYEDKVGELYRVAVNMDGTLNSNYKVPNSYDAEYNTFVRIHYGEPDYVPPEDPGDYPGGTDIGEDGPGRYDPDNPPSPSDFTDPVGFDGNAVLTRTYAVTASTLENIGQKLWTQSYFDVLKIQSNPIENIIAVKQFPFAIATGTTEEVKVGDVAFGINGLKVSRMWTHTFGSYTYTGKYKNYLDFAPFTQIKIFLPYIGLIQLDPADLYGSKLSVKYYVDLVTGECMAKLFMDEDTTTQKAIPYMSVFGQMGVDIPLTSTDRVQTELKAMSAGLSAFSGATMQLLGGDVAGAAINGATSALSIAGADYTSQRTCSMSPACASFDTQDVFIIIKRPAAEYIDRDAVTGYKHLHGYPCNKYLYLSSFAKGSFVQVDRRSDIKIAMTSAENQMLEQLLTTGVYI